ncbi:MAG: nucleotidyltransferase domain-containing protein [Chloroflexota bacterium]
MDKSTDAVLAEITQRIVAVSDPQQIILFGSQARGDAGSDSDLDILVIKDDVESLSAEAARIYRALAGLSTPVDVVVARSDYVRRHRDVIGTIVRPALREGRVLYVR